MDIVFHIGVPKSATSFLQAIAKNSAAYLSEGGIWYPEHSDPRIANHFDFLVLARQGGLDSILRYLACEVEKARDIGCKKILISHEELIFIAETTGRIEVVHEACKRLSLEASILVTGRPWSEFFASFAKQEQAMIGCPRWRDWAGIGGAPSLASFMVNNLNQWIKHFGEGKRVPYTDDSPDSIETRFFRAIGYNGQLHEVVPANVRKNRPMLAEIISGSIGSLYSALNKLELFDEKVERLNIEAFDKAVKLMSVAPTNMEWAELEQLIEKQCRALGDKLANELPDFEKEILTRYFS